jgi:hypothetical protein
MRCPYPNCQKDYNDSWPKLQEGWLSPGGIGWSIHEKELHHRLYVITRRCRFCGELFHDVSVGHENFEDHTKGFEKKESTLESLGQYPVSKTKFEAKTIPANILASFHEAERCRAAGSLTGSGACLRKTVYELCDGQNVVGANYREKIEQLPVKDGYKELLKQIKWLGDNTTKPGEEKYTMKMVDAALEILPIIIDDIYRGTEKEEEIARLLAKARSANN